MRDKVLIGYGQGFWGDSILGPVRLVREGPLDYLALDYLAEVTMSIENRYRFPRDTAAKILTAGLLGDQYIGLAAGGDTAELKNGDTLKITQSALVLESLIGQFLYSKAAEGGDKK